MAIGAGHRTAARGVIQSTGCRSQARVTTNAHFVIRGFPVLLVEGPALRITRIALRAMAAFAFRELKLVVEPGGAVALAALMSGKIDIEGKVAVAVLSGGNVDPELFYRLVA